MLTRYRATERWYRGRVGMPGGAHNTDDSIVVEGEITDDDLAAYAHAVRQAPVGRRGFAAVAVIYTVLLFFAVAAVTRSWTVAVIVLPLGLLIGYLVLPPLLQRRTRGRFSQRRSSARTPYRVRVTLDATGIVQDTDYGSAARRWFAVEDVLADAHGLYVRTSIVTVVIIPRRAFASEDAWRHTIEFVQYQFRNAPRPAGL